MQNISEFYPLLKNGKSHKVLITMHRAPDGDAMGAALAMKNFLQKLNHHVVVVSPTEWPEYFNWMPGADEILDFERATVKATKIIQQCEWIFCLDFNHILRTKNMGVLLQESTAIKILIDHHEMPMAEFFNYGISNPNKSSTCEMVYDFIADSGKKDLIDNAIRECIYTGIMTDTGSFRYKNVSSYTHKIVSEFLAYGLQQDKIHDEVFDSKPERVIRLLGYILSNKLTLYPEYHVALITISKEDFKNFHIRAGDTEGIVNYPLRIKGYNVAAMVVEKGNECKWSFRSKGEADVNEFAKKYFSGGGHIYAAGGITKKNLEDTLTDFDKAIKEFLAPLKP